MKKSYNTLRRKNFNKFFIKHLQHLTPLQIKNACFMYNEHLFESSHRVATEELNKRS
jgi:hypothetical protein